ncbi:hypothetical protein TSUD_67800 [Trifolium subterraneum]|uniref:Uncharacterized protein n=1 Tax=Trifolium subterraneum TaxID=3900 RepID=A0A2Z6MEI2_TRISU|nr:hypothetical protein TSUD_67800 [Trifolium subterraneum]
MKLTMNLSAFFIIILFSISHFVNSAVEPRLPRMVYAISRAKFHGKHKENLYWGTCRPQLYLGIRARYEV